MDPDPNCDLQKIVMLFNKEILTVLCRLHTAFLHWPLSSAATKEVQGPDTT
jgi:hypothetical protein